MMKRSDLNLNKSTDTDPDTDSDTDKLNDAACVTYNSKRIHDEKKDKTSKMDHNAFKSYLPALGHDLPMVEDREPEPEFETIPNVIDPNRDRCITLQDVQNVQKCMALKKDIAFLINRQNEGIQRLENAFQAIDSQERDYVTWEELYYNLGKEVADHFSARMKPYVDKSGQSITGALDYVEFIKREFSRTCNDHALLNSLKY